jgi:hypothetical protein
MNQQILEHLSKKVRTRQDEITEVIANGGVSDYAAYRELVGVIRGLATCQQEIEDLVRRFKEDDDE